ncbi:MAG TPA: 6-phosphogluconolactonase [Acidisarcina sp.]
MATEAHYQVSSSPAEMSRLAAERLVGQVESAVAARGVARVAISGGSTPKPMFELLANPAEPYLTRMPWSRVELFWVDERCVAPDNDESNYRMTREAMLDKIPLHPAQVFRMEGELDPEDAATRYEAVIRRQFGLEGAQAPVFDVVSLGMGPDGHTASLFPHTAALQERSRLVVANHVPQKDTWRITLTLPVILAGRDVSFLIQGGDKAHVLHEVLLGARDPETYPSQLIRPETGKLVLILDRQAAADLPAPGPNGWGKMEMAE